MKTRFIILFGCCLSFFIQATAQERPEVEWKEVDGVSIPVPPDVHPRL